MTTWKGRVEDALDPDVWEFLRADDAPLLPYDCEATADHARRLHAAGLLTDEELDEVEGRLAEIALDPSGYLESDEDVHSAIERLLGDVGRKIHAGRSRNDQVAAALRLFVLDACAEAREAIDTLALVCLSLAESEADSLMPGYTHLQRAQPITLGHHLLAWVEMLDRDRSRFAAAAEAASESPLGAGALAGSTLELYRALLLRRRESSLGSGSLAFVRGYGEDVVAFVNGSADGHRVLVVANLGAEPVPLPDGAEVIAASAPLDAGLVPTDTTVWVRWP